MTPEAVVREYRRCRREHFDKVYGIHSNQPRARECFRLAKQIVWVKENWEAFESDGVAVSCDGEWRLRVVPDSEPGDWGDMFDVALHADSVPGGKRTIEAQRKEWEQRLERDGVWGYVLEKKCEKCRRWEHVDSCFGFDGEVPEYELIAAQYQARGEA